LRPSLRLCLQTESPLQACALRLRSTLRPPSGLRSTPARAFVSCLPSSQPSGRLLSGVRLSPRAPICSQPSGNAIQLEPLTPGPDLAARVSRLRPAFGIVSPACAFDFNPPASVPRLVPILPAPALRPAPLVSVNSSGLDPRALDPPGLRPSYPPCDWTSSAFGLRLLLLLSSPLVLPRRPFPLNPGLRLHSVSGSSVPSWFLRTSSSGAFQIALPLRACALCFRSILRPAFRFGLRLAPSARPSSCLRCVPPDLRPSAHPPAPPRACRLFMTLGLRLVPCRPAPFESS